MRNEKFIRRKYYDEDKSDEDKNDDEDKTVQHHGHHDQEPASIHPFLRRGLTSMVMQGGEFWSTISKIMKPVILRKLPGRC